MKRNRLDEYGALKDLKVVNQSNVAQQKKKFFSPVAKPANNQRRQVMGGAVSPDYQKSWNQQKNSGLYSGSSRTPTFSAPGFSGSAKKARINSQRIQYERERRKAADAIGLEGMRQEGQTGRVGLRGQNQLASIGLQGQNQLANIGLSGQNQLANIGLQGQNQLANTRLLSKLEDQKNVNGLSQEHQGNLLMKLSTAYEEAKMTAGVPKDEKGNFISLEDWTKQTNPRLYDLLNPQQQGLQVKNLMNGESTTGPTRKRADGSYTNLSYTPQELFEETQLQELDASGYLDNARYVSDNIDTYDTAANSQITSGGQLIPADIAATQGQPSFLQSLITKGKAMTAAERATKAEERRVKLSRSFGMEGR